MKLKATLSIFLLSFLVSATNAQQKLEPTLTQALVNVLVVNERYQPLEGEIVSFVSQKNGEEFRSYTNAEGRFSLLLPIGDVYEISYRDLFETVAHSIVEIPSEEALYEINITIVFEKIIQYNERIIVLENVEFDFDSSVLRPSSFSALDDLVEVMTIRHRMEIEISGHTDSRGSEAHNMRLSQARAESVRNYLISRGINANRITAVGYGPSRPIAPNVHPDGSDNPEGRQQNRRTEVRITQQH